MTNLGSKRRGKSAIRKKILVFHDGIFAAKTGSTEKLLCDMIEHLLGAGFAVRAVSRAASIEKIPESFKDSKDFSYTGFESAPRAQAVPFDFAGMTPNLDSILAEYDPDCILAVVWSEYQFPIIQIPAIYPLILISPFGHFCTNGNVRHVYVSGRRNLNFLQMRHVVGARLFFNPLPIPKNHIKKSKPLATLSASKPFVFGRTGRGDDAIFDPISLRAFARIEKKYGDKVVFKYVNPSPKAKALVKELGLRRVQFLSWLSIPELDAFYHQIDVFAHARYDGETIGISIGEALVHGCPVVTHKSRHNNDHLALLALPYGRVADIDDVDAYAQHMEWFITNADKLGSCSKAAFAAAVPLFDEKKIWNDIISDFAGSCTKKGQPLQSALSVRAGRIMQATKARLLQLMPVRAKEILKEIVYRR